ncbi:BnaC03g13710D [Brassica napus]|uniref:(rape) hypothetical protein n=1 Tax=Brassica napus TaxID=3708 RepID=A0A078FC12_BRANA|nr:unnamed protein product [Brassica napus]CDY11945.1 BnaC03g13710D [Brassica napus]
MPMSNNSPFSMSTMSNALQHIRVSSSIPPPGFASRASDVSDTRLKRLFNLMTSCEGVGQFKDLISTFDQSQLQMMASLLTSDSDYFMEVVSNKYGSRRVQKLLGYASYVATRAVVVFDQVKKHVMYKHVLHYALDIARYQHGCVALNEVIIDADGPLYRNRLLDVVARNALKLYDLRSTHNMAVSLRGHCVDLSFKKYGSYIVEKPLEAEEIRKLLKHF